MLKTNHFSVLFFLSIFFLTQPLYAANNTSLLKEKLIYAGTESEGYDIKLLKLALSYDKKVQYHLSPFGQHQPKMREFSLLGQPKGIDIVVGGATIERERLALAIRIPIMKGLYGWRIALVHKENTKLFKNVKTLEQFKQLKALQFHTWSDSKIFALNNIKLVKGSDVRGLYFMLDKKRADYFPRSVLEIDGDLARHSNLDITKETDTLIWYPKAVYFYVGKNQLALANKIAQGLELALADGEFEKLFSHFYGDIVNKLKTEKRTIFKLSNPLLSPETPLQRRDLWLDLSSQNKH